MRVCVIVSVLLLCAVPFACAGDAVDDDLAVIAKTGPKGTSSAVAKAARERLAKQGIEILPKLLGAMDTTNVVAANWYRTVFDAVVSRELARPEPKLPVSDMKDYVRDGRKQGKARRLVLDLLDKLEPQFRPSVVPTLLDDSEFRTDAVAAVLQAAEKAAADPQQKDAAVKLFQDAFDHARQVDQVQSSAARLKTLGTNVDVAEHLGILTDWWIIGPFAAPEFTGFEAIFPPQQEPFNEQSTYKDSAGSLKWKRHQTSDALGQVDLNQALVNSREAVAYAYAEVDSPREQKVQLRCGADDNLTVWVNGQKVFGRFQWLNGTRMDRFVAPAMFKAGRNTVLVKICQGPQHADPGVTNNWTFQVRFCDDTGKGVGLKSALPAK